MKALDAVMAFVVVVGLTGLVVSNSGSVATLAQTGVQGVGYLTQVAQLRTPSTYIRYQ